LEADSSIFYHILDDRYIICPAIFFYPQEF